jgi:RNA polymerase sigma-70 factor (ECF subfamily)
MSDIDANLVARCRGGSTEAFGTLVERYERVVFNLALRMVRDRDDAADITQSVFLLAYEKLDSYDPTYRFFSWLYRIAVNQTLNFLGRRRRFDPLDDDAPDVGDSADAACLRSEAADHVRRALASVAIDQRIVLVLRHFLFLSYGEIGAILEIPEKTVKSRLYTARQFLKDALVRQGYAS